MAMKEWLYHLQPLQLYTILFLSVIYFVVQLFLSHITHSLTLLTAAYHSLVNIIALSGCLVTVKFCDKTRKRTSNGGASQSLEENAVIDENNLPGENVTVSIAHDGPHDHAMATATATAKAKATTQETALRNTFGWTRVDVVVTMINCIFLASLCFSLLVEAVQTLVHIGHQDTMHHPVPVLVLGTMGLVLNGLAYLLIGGFTFHQGSFLYITPSGDVILDRVVTEDGAVDALRQGDRRLSRTKKVAAIGGYHERSKRQSFNEFFRDICSTIFVIICSVVVFVVDDESISKFIDPIISVVSCVVLLFLSYPYMKESGLILLQTIPGSIDIEVFKTNLLASFSEIVSVHDLHIWQLTARKYVSTAHIIFHDPTVYLRIMEEVVEYFQEQGISIVTIQPEFQNRCTTDGETAKLSCLVKCQDNACYEKHCCPLNTDEAVTVRMPLISSDCAESAAGDHHHNHNHNHNHDHNHDHENKIVVEIVTVEETAH